MFYHQKVARVRVFADIQSFALSDYPKRSRGREATGFMAHPRPSFTQGPGCFGSSQTFQRQRREVSRRWGNRAQGGPASRSPAKRQVGVRPRRACAKGPAQVATAFPHLLRRAKGLADGGTGGLGWVGLAALCRSRPSGVGFLPCPTTRLNYLTVRFQGRADCRQPPDPTEAQVGRRYRRPVCRRARGQGCGRGCRVQGGTWGGAGVHVCPTRWLRQQGAWPRVAAADLLM